MQHRKRPAPFAPPDARQSIQIYIYLTYENILLLYAVIKAFLLLLLSLRSDHFWRIRGFFLEGGVGGFNSIFSLSYPPFGYATELRRIFKRCYREAERKYDYNIIFQVS